MTEIKILCPRCPLCSGRPAKGLPLSISQAWCDNDDCAALCWDPSMSLDDNLINSHAHRLGDWLTLCYGLDVPHARGLHPDQCQGCMDEGSSPRKNG